MGKPSVELPYRGLSSSLSCLRLVLQGLQKRSEPIHGEASETAIQEPRNARRFQSQELSDLATSKSAFPNDVVDPHDDLGLRRCSSASGRLRSLKIFTRLSAISLVSAEPISVSGLLYDHELQSDRFSAFVGNSILDLPLRDA